MDKQDWRLSLFESFPDIPSTSALPSSPLDPEIEIQSSSAIYSSSEGINASYERHIPSLIETYKKGSIGA